MMTQKTPTCILFDKSGNFHSFGYEAESKYRILTETDEDDDSDDSDDSDNEKDKCEIEEDNVTEWLYFSRFRTKLFQDKLVCIIVYALTMLSKSTKHMKLKYNYKIRIFRRR